MKKNLYTMNKNTKKRCCSVLFLLSFTLTLSAQVCNVIPRPQTINFSNGEIELSNYDISYYVPDLEKDAKLLRSRLDGIGKRGTVVLRKKIKRSQRGIILLSDQSFHPEAYQLKIMPKQVVICGGSNAAVFYGAQTFLQQLESGKLYAGTISDEPRYAWRGLMLDESRHFFGVEKVKQLLDVMAYYKLNKLHWHLTDEPAWRLEIKKYPLLTEVGGRGNWHDPNDTTALFYTHDEVRELVAYAAERHIDVVPEIDMPGHATAACRAYPFLSGGGTKEHPDFTFNVASDSVYSFLTDVMREVASLFPFYCIHLGGDEVAYGIDAWKKNSQIQALMQREGYTNVRQAEGYFMRRMMDSVRALGKTPMGWDEVVTLGVSEQTPVMWWRHDQPSELNRALKNGFTTILCPRLPLYFDFIQNKGHRWGRTWGGKYVPIEDVYAFPDSSWAKWKLSAEQTSRIIGMQANVWSERMQNVQRLDFMIYPRLCALAESAWTHPMDKDYADFSRRLEFAYQFFDGLHIYYYDTRNSSAHPEPKGVEK